MEYDSHTSSHTVSSEVGAAAAFFSALNVKAAWRNKERCQFYLRCHRVTFDVLNAARVVTCACRCASPHKRKAMVTALSVKVHCTRHRQHLFGVGSQRSKRSRFPSKPLLPALPTVRLSKPMVHTILEIGADGADISRKSPSSLPNIILMSSVQSLKTRSFLCVAKPWSQQMQFSFLHVWFQNIGSILAQYHLAHSIASQMFSWCVPSVFRVFSVESVKWWRANPLMSGPRVTC